ncbi:MAG: hypothetical protein Kow0069_25320 [Promethearchaeota archaeon]
MGRPLKQLWVITGTGLPLFDWRPPHLKESVNPNFISGFMSAILTMVGADQDAIEDMHLGNAKLVLEMFRAKDTPGLEKVPFDLVLIAHVSPKTKSKAVKRVLGKLGKAFVECYGPVLEDWNCDTTLFQDFVDQVRDYFETA